MLTTHKLCVKSAIGLREKCPHVALYGFWESHYAYFNPAKSWVVASWEKDEFIPAGAGWWYWKSYTTKAKAEKVAAEQHGRVFHKTQCIKRELLDW